MFCWRSSRIHGVGEAEGDRGAGGQVRQRSIGSLWVGAAEVAVPVHVPAGSAAATRQPGARQEGRVGDQHAPRSLGREFGKWHSE